MWDSPLYAINMFYYHCLIKKLLWPMVGQNIARQEIQAEIEEEGMWGQGDSMLPPKKQEVTNHEPHSKMESNRNRLI